MTRCDRCFKETRVHTMSFFNTDVICMECYDKEKKHPKYKAAKEVEVNECKQGNYNFNGVGKPSDL